MAEKQERLLLLTPNPDQLAHLISLIGEVGYAIADVETIELAQKAIDAGQIDLLILDGRALGAAEQQNIGSFVGRLSATNLPVIVLADSGEMENVAHFINCGAVDYLQAPFDRTQIRLRIASNLERSRLMVEQHDHLQHSELLKIEQDIQIARRIQAGFLPDELPQPNGWEIAARFKPAREVAGDFYDSFMLSQ